MSEQQTTQVATAPDVFHLTAEGEFSHASPARESPRERGVFLLPAGATFLAPPETQAGKARVFRDDAWTLVDDVRGVYFDGNGNAVVWRELEAPPAGLTREAPPPSPERLRADIDRRRDEDLVAGVQLEGLSYHSDDRFLVELIGFVAGYQAGIYSGTQNIRTRDNQIVQRDLAGIIALAAAVGEHRKAVYAASWAAKDAL